MGKIIRGFLTWLGAIAAIYLIVAGLSFCR